LKHPRLTFKFEDMDKMPNHKELGYSFKKESAAVHVKHKEIVLVLKGRPAEAYKVKSLSLRTVETCQE